MVDIKFHNDNLCSIAGIDNNFSGKSIIRGVLNEIISQASFIAVEAYRPYYEIIESLKSVSKISEEIDYLTVAPDKFYILFNYFVKADNDNFVETFLNIWFEFEQPSFTFLTEMPEINSDKGLFFDKNLKYKELVESLNCFLLFRSAEEDVMWISKSDHLKFEGLYL